MISVGNTSSISLNHSDLKQKKVSEIRLPEKAFFNCAIISIDAFEHAKLISCVLHFIAMFSCLKVVLYSISELITLGEFSYGGH